MIAANPNYPDRSVGRIHLQCRRPGFDPWVDKIPWRRDMLPNPVFLYFPCGSAGEESTCNVGDLGSIPGLGRSPGEGKGYPLQYSGLENSMDCVVHGFAKSQTWLSDFHFHFQAKFKKKTKMKKQMHISNNKKSEKIKYKLGNKNIKKCLEYIKTFNDFKTGTVYSFIR